MKPTVIISLDLRGTDDFEVYENYQQLSGKHKIDFICQRINELMIELLEREPNCNYVVAWHEYGITEGQDRYISPVVKRYLKEKTSQLAKMYPNLLIIAGTVAEKKPILERDKFHQRLSSIKESYELQEQQEREALRRELGFEIDEDISEYEPQPNPEIVTEIEKIDDELENQDEFSDKRCLIKNTAYIISNEKIFRHNKSTPVKETFEPHEGEVWTEVAIDALDFISPPQSIFQPYNKRNEKHIFPVQLENDQLIIGIETCSEHLLGKIKKHHYHVDSQIDFQFTLAYGGRVNPLHIVADYYVLFDHVISPKLIVNKPVHMSDLEDFPVRLYSYALHRSTKSSLSGPYIPIYSEEKNVVSQLDQLINLVENTFKDSHLHREELFNVLSRLKNTLLESILFSQPMDESALLPLESEARGYISTSFPEAIHIEFSDIVGKIKQLNYRINLEDREKTFTPKKPLALRDKHNAEYDIERVVKKSKR